MFGNADQAISRRQLFTEAAPRGLDALLRSVLRAREELHAWAATESAPLYAWARPVGSETLKALRALETLDEIGERCCRQCSVGTRWREMATVFEHVVAGRGQRGRVDGDEAGGRAQPAG